MTSSGKAKGRRARPRPLVLVVLDGFGIGHRAVSDAIAAAHMPNWRRLLAEWPSCRLEASGEAVGLPAGQMGNSEVGHLNLGAGMPVRQDLPRIDAAITDGTFFSNAALNAAVERAANGHRLHLVGLVGPGGVHSVDRHAVAIAELAARRGVSDVLVHALLDGRDTAPRSAEEFVPDLERRLAEVNAGARIATVGGRYFAMDRDQRWERIALGYAAIVGGAGMRAPSAPAAVRAGYERGESDEFLTPTVVDGIDGRLRDGDAIVHFNFRADRARQLIHALVDGVDFDERAFERGKRPANVLVVTMTEYEAELPVAVAFPPEVAGGLSETFSQLGWRQFHVAETEKYAHVTYFFNGGVEAPFPGEERLLVPSPKVATYDLLPEMSAGAVTDALVAAIAAAEYDFVVANYANADMVGHTGVWDAAVRAVEFLDSCLGRVERACRDAGDALLAITADHGNADEMRDGQGRPVTAHSLNPVPLLISGEAVRGARLRDGVLADVAPTLLELIDVPIPPSMTGRSLLDG